MHKRIHTQTHMRYKWKIYLRYKRIMTNANQRTVVSLISIRSGNSVAMVVVVAAAAPNKTWTLNNQRKIYTLHIYICVLNLYNTHMIHIEHINNKIRLFEPKTLWNSPIFEFVFNWMNLTNLFVDFVCVCAVTVCWCYYLKLANWLM